MINFSQNIKCYSNSRLLLKYLKGDNIGFYYNYISKLVVEREVYIFFPDKLRNILSKFSEEIPYVYTGYYYNYITQCTITDRYKHSDKLYSHYDIKFMKNMRTYIVIPTSNKKLIATLKLCL